jgi:purine-binding chemotaxis protein CheW
VREKRPFNLARDPHACKFGLWYDKYQAENTLLKMTLRKMDEPHKIIHASADEALRLAGQGQMEEAMNLLALRRSQELASLVRLFEEARNHLQEHHRELAVVLSRGEKRFAISIDRVEAVERIPEESIETMTAGMLSQGGDRYWRVGKRNKTNQTILLLEEDLLVSSEVLN